ncbi:MAG: LysR family transcriptional regulator [Myxococcota bacterium]
MSILYERDLDLNLLRVFLAVADTGSVTEAASVLYVTQPAVSAALRRLRVALGVDLFVREGRGLALTARGRRLAAEARPHFEGLLAAAVAPGEIDLRASDRVVRLGLSDANESWLLPGLLDAMAAEAPAMSLVVVPVQFRTVFRALETAEVDLALTVVDDLPVGTLRMPLFQGPFLAVFDPRHVTLDDPATLEGYLGHDHVIVSYNGDRRGIVEDLYGHRRRVRISVPTFHAIGALLDGRSLVATVPRAVAREIRSVRPHLAAVQLPFELGTVPMEMVWRRAIDDDPAIAWVRAQVERLAGAVG